MTELVTRRVIEVDSRVAPTAGAGVQNATKAMSGLEAGMRGVLAVAATFAGAILGALSLHEFVDAVDKSIDRMVKLREQIKRVGGDAEEFQKLVYAGKLAGVSAGQIESAYKQLSKGIAGLGVTKQGKALENLGIGETDTAYTALLKLSDALEALPDEKKVATIMGALGRGGSALLPLFEGGSKAIKEAGEELARFGGIKSQDTLDVANQFDSTMTAIKTNMGAIIDNITAGLLPALKDISGIFRDMDLKPGDWKALGEALGVILKVVVALVTAFGLAIKSVFDLLGEISNFLAKLQSGDVQGAMDSLSGSVDRMNESQKGMLGLINRMLGLKPPDVTGWYSFDTVLNILYRTLKNIVDTVDGIGKAGAELVRGAVKAAFDKLTETFKQWWGYFKDIYDWIGKIGDKLKGFDFGKLNPFKSSSYQGGAQGGGLMNAAYQVGGPTVPQTYSDYTDSVDTATEAVTGLTTAQYALIAQNPAYQEMWDAWVTNAGTASTATKETSATMVEFSKEAYQAIAGFSRDASQAVVDFALGTQVSIEDMVTNIVKQFAKMAADILIFKPIFEAFGSWLTGVGGGAGGGAIGTVSAHGSVFNRAGMMAFQRGGIVSSPTVFPFAGGVGLMGEAGPEAIMPLARNASGDLGVRAAAPATNVYVINNSKASTKTEEQTRPDGGTDVRVLVEDAVERGFATGRFDSTLANNYGVNRRGRN